MKNLQKPLTIPGMIRNRDGLYEGNLVHYLRVLFKYALNLNNPYHNFRHMFHVFYLCYKACIYYRNELTPREMRNLLIAALFHDFDHRGKSGNDDINILIALRGLAQHIAEEDKEFEEDIAALIRPTEYPHKIPASELSLSAQILRDADVSQAFSVAWIQQVIFGLATEMGKSPVELLKMQGLFLNSLTFSTEWAKAEFGESIVEDKIQEAEEMLEMINEDSAA